MQLYSGPVQHPLSASEKRLFPTLFSTMLKDMTSLCKAVRKFIFSFLLPALYPLMLKHVASKTQQMKSMTSGKGVDLYRWPLLSLHC